MGSIYYYYSLQSPFKKSGTVEGALKQQSSIARMDLDYKCLYVKDLNSSTTANELRPIFEASGDIITLRKLSPVTAIVSYTHEDDARKAIDRLNGANIHGNVVHVSFKRRKMDKQRHRASSSVSESFQMELHKLRYMSACHKIRNCLKNLQADVSIDLDNVCLSIVGSEACISKARQEIEGLMSSFAIVTAPLSDVFRQCFRPVKPAEIVGKFKNCRIIAGWDVSNDQLHICSNNLQNAQKALELIRDIVVELEYPTGQELSSAKIGLVAGAEWIDFRTKLKADDTTNTLEIQYDHTIKKIRFALRSSGNSHSVVLALDEFFRPFNNQERVMPLGKDVAQLISKNKEYVLKLCSQDGVTIHFDDLLSSHSCTVKSQSAELLDSAIRKLKMLVDRKVEQSISFTKLSAITWLSSSTGKERLADVNSLSHTISAVSGRRTRMRVNAAAQPTSSADVRASPVDRLEIVKGDISTIKADGLVSCEGVVARAIQKETDGAILQRGLQIINKHTSGSVSEVYVYHMKTSPLDSSGEALEHLRKHVKRAYLQLSGSGVKVIAFPAIGTGSRGYPPETVASVMVETVVNSLDSHNSLDSDQKVQFVIHPQSSDDVFRAFERTLQKYKPQTPVAGPSPAETLGVSIKAMVTFTGLQDSDVQKAVTRLEKEMKQHITTIGWGVTSGQDAVKRLTDGQVTELRKMARSKRVEATIDRAKGILTLEGLKDDVHSLRDHVNSILRGKSSKANVFPSHWDETALARGEHEVKLHRYSSEYSTVSCKFFESCDTVGVTITEITRIQNEHLYTQYQAQKSKVKKELAGDKSVLVERDLWHGTTAESVKQICANEFNRSFAGTNGMTYGQGSYFSTTTQYSLQYSDGLVDKYMILAKVATGRYQRGNRETQRKNLPPGCHSTVNSPSTPTIFVVYHDAAAYPEYVIKFTKQHAQHHYY